MPSAFNNPDEASAHLEALTGRVCDVFDDLFIHTQETLRQHRNLDDLNEDQTNCLVRAALRTVELDEGLAVDIEAARHSLQAWMTAFAAVPLTDANKAAHTSTRIFFFCVWIWIEMWRDATAMQADRFETQYSYMIDLCEEYIEDHLANHSMTGASSYLVQNKMSSDGTEMRLETPPAFSLGTGIVSCLCAIVERCRDSGIRRRCIATLERINLQGIFDNTYLIAHLQAVVDTEEQRAREKISPFCTKDTFEDYEIPEPARLLEVVMSPSFHADKKDFYKSDRVSLVFVVRQSSELGNENLRIEEKSFVVGKGEVGSCSPMEE